MQEVKEPIYKKENGSYVMMSDVTGKVDYWCGFPDSPDSRHAEVESYLAEHPEALVPEPVPPPTPEQIAEQERQANLAYLASTDWYAIRFADTGEAMPADIKTARQAARDAL